MAGVVGVTHLQYDFDGGSSLRLLERARVIQRRAFGHEAYLDVIAKGEAEKLIFVDYSPVEPISEVPVQVYDHHSHESDTATNKKGRARETAFSIVCDALDMSGYDGEKLRVWKDLVWRCDSQVEQDPMDMIRLLRNGVNRFMESDQDSFEQWFAPVFDSFFDNAPDLDRAIRVMTEEAKAFLVRIPDTPVRHFVEKWIERGKEKVKIERGTPRNFLRFMAYMEEDRARKWIRLILEGLHADGVEFRASVAEFKRAQFDFFGETMIVSAVTERTKFVQAARATIFSDEEKPAVIDEKFVIGKDPRGKTLRNKNKPWVVIQVHPGTRNFQIFINGNSESVHRTMVELAKAVRAQILERREAPVPDEAILACDGGLEGTEPLYYNKNVTFPQILWGSLKHPKEPASPLMGRNPMGILNELIKTTKLALDPHEFAADCNPASCADCMIVDWQLKKCEAKRTAVGEPSKVRSVSPSASW